MNFRKILPIGMIVVLSLFMIAAGLSCQKKDDPKAVKTLRAQEAILKKHQVSPLKTAKISLEDIYDKKRNAAINDAITALDGIEKKIKTDEMKSELYSLKGEAYGMMRLVSKSDEAFKKAKSYSPTNYQVYKRWGRTHYINHDYVNANIRFSEALKFIPTINIKDRIEIMFYLADIMEKQKDYARAEAYYRDLVKLAEDYAVKTEYYVEGKKRLKLLESE